MSTGATIATAVRAGAKVDILTVFGYGPGSNTPADAWDSKSGFATEGEACRVRRLEDREACGILGATPQWFDFGSDGYERHGSRQEILSSVIAAVAGADCVLIPGFPLLHPDHDELTRLLLGARLHTQIGLYAEQPYAFWERKRIDPAMQAPALENTLNSPLLWTRRRTDREARWMKWRAVRCYRSQLYQLGLARVGLFHLLWHESAQGGEAIAWLP